MKTQSWLNRLPLASLSVFDIAARTLSFKEAAVTLGVTPAAVSHRIRGLESILGVTLFERSNRSLSLTDAGLCLAKDVRSGINAIERGLTNLETLGHIGRPGGDRIRISAAPTFATRWLAPRLPEFHKRYPGVEVELLADQKLLDMSQSDIDVAIRYGPISNLDLPYEQTLFDPVMLVIVGCPELVDASLKASQDPVLSIPLLATQAPRPVDAGDYSLWRRSLTEMKYPKKVIDAKLRGAQKFNNSDMAIDAAIRGDGLALCPLILVEAVIANGTLRLLSTSPVQDPNSFTLIVGPMKSTDRAVQGFSNWISSY